MVLYGGGEELKLLRVDELQSNQDGSDFRLQKRLWCGLPSLRQQ